MSQELKIGDIICLKSGGPEMTVARIFDDGKQVSTQWFGGKKLEKGAFPIESIEIVENE